MTNGPNDVQQPHSNNAHDDDAGDDDDDDQKPMLKYLIKIPEGKTLTMIYVMQFVNSRQREELQT
jgi:hypothetical protein